MFMNALGGIYKYPGYSTDIACDICGQLIHKNGDMYYYSLNIYSPFPLALYTLWLQRIKAFPCPGILVMLACEKCAQQTSETYGWSIIWWGTALCYNTCMGCTWSKHAKSVATSRETWEMCATIYWYTRRYQRNYTPACSEWARFVMNVGKRQMEYYKIRKCRTAKQHICRCEICRAKRTYLECVLFKEGVAVPTALYAMIIRKTDILRFTLQSDILICSTCAEELVSTGYFKYVYTDWRNEEHDWDSLSQWRSFHSK